MDELEKLRGDIETAYEGLILNANLLNKLHKTLNELIEFKGEVK